VDSEPLRAWPKCSAGGNSARRAKTFLLGQLARPEGSVGALVLPGVVAEWLNAAVLKGDPTPSHSVQLSLPRPLYPFTTCTAVRFSPAKWANPWLTRHSTVLAARFDQTWLEDSDLRIVAASATSLGGCRPDTSVTGQTLPRSAPAPLRGSASAGAPRHESSLHRRTRAPAPSLPV
jgi:hypothetical protein